MQLPELEEPTLRARFHTDSQGRYRFWTILPRYYPIPYDGTVGDMLKATARHPYRPAHVHFMIMAPGHERLVTHLFVSGDQYLDSDAVFAVKNSLIRDFTREAPGVAPDGLEGGHSVAQAAQRFRAGESESRGKCRSMTVVVP